MNRFVSIAFSLLIAGSIGSVWSQTLIPTSSAVPATQPTGKESKPRINDIRGRMKQQNERINLALKQGKLTQEEARTLREKVKTTANK